MTARRASRAITLAAVPVTVASVALVVSPPDATTYAAASPAAGVVTVLAGVLLSAAGGVLAWTGRRGSSGLTVLALGVVWWAPVWVGWEDGPALVRSVGMVVAPFVPAVLLHLAASLPAGRITSAPVRRGVLAAYSLTVGYTLVRAVVRDPFLDLYCWSNCTDNVFLLSAQPGLARALDTGWAAVSGLVALAAVVLAVRRLVATTPVGRRTRWPVLVPVTVAAGATAAYGVHLLLRPGEDPDDPAYLAGYGVTAVALALLGAGVVWLIADDQRQARALERLAADDDGGGGGDLEPTLASALGDPTVRVAFWLPEQGLVDRDGRRVSDDDARAHLDLVRGEERVARVWHDPALRDTTALGQRVGSAAVLAVDNERLRAQLLAQVRDLRESRTRVVAAADAARRALERDLHDGAQQRLLALTLELRVAHAQASAAGITDLAEDLDRAVEQAARVVAELRALARGIYPAVLDQAGLDAALRALAEAAPLPMTLDPLPVPDDVPAPAARVAYLAVSEAVEAASVSGVEHLHVALARQDGRLVLEIRPNCLTSSTLIEDRVGAAGGSVEQRHSGLRLEVPCA